MANGVEITLGTACPVGEIHDWFFLTWQLFPDFRNSMYECTNSVVLTWNIFPQIVLLLVSVIVIGFIVYKRRKASLSNS